MRKPAFTKKEKALIITLANVIAAISIFVIVFWNQCYTFLDGILKDSRVARDYIMQQGWLGVMIIAVSLILCFFFPVLPSSLFQFSAGFSYGIWRGTALVMVSFGLASQILWLFRKNMLIFSGEKYRQKSEQMKKRIQNSKLGIHRAMIIAYIVPFIPFLLISSLALEGLDYKYYTIYTFLGPMGEILVTILLGEALLNSSPAGAVITMLATVCFLVFSFVFKEKILNRLFRAEPKSN